MSDKKRTAKSENLWAAVAVLILGLIFLSAAACRSEPQVSASRLGMRGGDVYLLQQRLYELGFYRGKISGEFDLETQKSLLDFQRENELPLSGIADTATREKLGMQRDPLSQYSDTELLARFIEWKAGGGSYIDKLSAGAVVLNRMASPSYPDTVSGVIFQGGELSEFATAVYKSEPSSASIKAAEDCVGGADPTGGSTDFQ